MFHLDSTYKITKNSYPLLIFGVSDVNRKCFLLAAFIVSQTTAEMVKHCISPLQSTAANLVPDLIRWTPDYVMSDADPAHLNAVTACFGINVRFLFCFFHLKKNVRDRTKSLSKALYNEVMADINVLHLCRTEANFETRWTEIKQKWEATPTLVAFTTYFELHWIRSPFAKWQCFWSPMGYAKTNNPIEVLNSDLKKTYTLRKRLSIKDTLLTLQGMIKTESTIHMTTQVAERPGTVKRFKKIGKDLYHQGILVVTEAGGRYML